MSTKIDPDYLMEIAEEQMYGMGNGGFCTSCGAEHDCCEPDARKYKCDECGKMTVYGASELVMMGYAN